MPCPNKLINKENIKYVIPRAHPGYNGNPGHGIPWHSTNICAEPPTNNAFPFAWAFQAVHDHLRQGL
jgi:hypothetical protein